MNEDEPIHMHDGTTAGKGGSEVTGGIQLTRQIGRHPFVNGSLYPACYMLQGGICLHEGYEVTIQEIVRTIKTN